MESVPRKWSALWLQKRRLNGLSVRRFGRVIMLFIGVVVSINLIRLYDAPSLLSAFPNFNTEGQIFNRTLGVRCLTFILMMLSPI